MTSPEGTACAGGARRALAIVNPATGRRKVERVEAEIVQAALGHGLDVEVRRTERLGDAERWAAAARGEGFDLLIVAGGDGTVAAALGGSVQIDDPLAIAIVPLGTGNGLARALRIPFRPGPALHATLDGRVVAHDVASIEPFGHRFVMFFGAGYDADVNADANRHDKRRFGFIAYVRAGLVRLTDRRPHRVTLTLDGRTVRTRAHTVSVFNAGSFAFGDVVLGPRTRPDDGLLDVTVLREPGAWGTLRDVTRLILGRSRDGTSWQARSIRVAAEPPLPVHADGEVLGRTPVAITVLPTRARLLAPRSGRAPT